MKKLLSILGTISLIISGSGNLISCKNNMFYESKEKLKIEKQKPPKGSNWKLIDNSKKKLDKEFRTPLNNKWYIMIYGGSHKLITMTKRDKCGKITLYIAGFYTGIFFGNIKYFNIQNISIYRWDGLNKPNIPKIDNFGKIIDWNEINMII